MRGRRRAARGLRSERPAAIAETGDHDLVTARHVSRHATLQLGLRCPTMTLPGSPHIAYRGDALFFEGCSAAELARAHGTPLYAYSKTSMLDALASYQRALEGRDHLICYAMKANSNLAVIQTFAQAGCGFDIVSGG